MRARDGRPAQVRLSRVTAGGATARSQPRPLGRRPARLVLSLGPARAALTVDRAQLGPIEAAGQGALAAGVALGPWRAGPAASHGYLDIDRVTVQIAPPAS